SGRPQLYVLNIDGGRPSQLSTGTEEAANPFWSADGRWVYFSIEKNPGIWKVAAEGGNAIRLTDGDGYNPQESDDGSRIYYGRGPDPVDVWWVAANGGESHRLEGMPSLATGDHWTPSKNGIYFIDAFASPATLNLFDPTSRRVTRVSNLPGGFGGWGPGLNV